MFYVFAPFIVRRKLVVILSVLLLSLGLRILLAFLGLKYAPWDYMFFPTQIMFFMGGVLSHHLYNYIKNKIIDKSTLLSLYLFFLLIITLYYQFFQESYFKEAFLFCTTILLIPFAFVLTKKSKLDRYFGDLSYPIYISQALFIKLATIKSFPNPYGKGLSVLVLVISFSVLLQYIITKPLEKYRQARVKRNIKMQ